VSKPVPGAARIADRGYQHYTGRRVGGGHAFWTMARGALDRALGRRRKVGFGTVLKYLAVLFANAPIVFTLATQASNGTTNFSYPDYLSGISLLSILFAALVAPDLLCPDRRERVLTLYFAAPITRLQYLLANAAALTALMLAITLLPLLAYFVGAAVLSGSALGYAGDHTGDLWHLLLGGTLAAGYYAALALLAAGFNDRRAYAAAAFLGTLLVSAAASAILSQGMRFGGHERFALLDLLQLPIRATRWLFGVPPEVANANRIPPYIPTVDGVAYVGMTLALIVLAIGAVVWHYLRSAD